ncbi:hypothetical protein DWB77_03753 [Streptomyces hundungensis]|uniref:Uncharacterized protein n=1 Tax=Streptomyces hundungensis TaxID=1077946 RepID=A0A387HH75_9ACTN|nr:hypothetical protein DWB77_03753 [Streptomyces hundungensis]
MEAPIQRLRLVGACGRYPPHGTHAPEACQETRSAASVYTGATARALLSAQSTPRPRRDLTCDATRGPKHPGSLSQTERRLPNTGPAPSLAPSNILHSMGPNPSRIPPRHPCRSPRFPQTCPPYMMGKIMRDVFALISEAITRDFRGEPICAHVGDVRACTIKSHPPYKVLRKTVRLGRSRSVKSLRLWESVVTLAREGEPQEREKWLMILLDLLTLHFRGWSKELAQQWSYDLSDIRSAMVHGALEEWFSAPTGTPSNKLLDAMMARAFASARALVEAGRSETCAVSVEDLMADAAYEEGSTLRAASILDASTMLNPDSDERIRGERTGALLQSMGVMDHVKTFHAKLRSGCRDEVDASAISPEQLGRSWVDGRNLYYQFSDLLPTHLGFRKAADAAGLSESQASRKSNAGSLSFRVLWNGNSRVVPVKSLMRATGVHDSVVHPDDVENGASHVGG